MRGLLISQRLNNVAETRTRKDSVQKCDENQTEMKDLQVAFQNNVLKTS